MSEVDSGPTPLETGWALQLILFLNDLFRLVAWVDGVRLLQLELSQLLRASHPRSVEPNLIVVSLLHIARVSYAPAWLNVLYISASIVVEIWQVG